MIFACSIIAFALIILAVLAKGGLSHVARGRKYKSGTGWCFWRFTDVESEYILRLHIVKTPIGAICLHWIRKPDREPWLHDHPVTFLSLVLRGKYAEMRARGDGDIGVQVIERFNFIRARKHDRHRIVFTRKNTLTLCFMGPKTREWGFHMPAGWLGWKDYYARLKAGEDMRQELGSAYPPGGIIAWLDREYGSVLNAMTRRAECIGTPVDEDKRAIDSRPADPYNAEDFAADEETEPFARPR